MVVEAAGDGVDERVTGTHACFLRPGDAAAERARSKAVLRDGLAVNALAVAVAAVVVLRT